MNPTVKLVLGLVIIGALGAVHALIPLEPGWAWLTTAGQLLGAAALYFTVPGVAAAKMAKAGIK